jgi:CTP:molybdopterin cytidylyltransferase MocA
MRARRIGRVAAASLCVLLATSPANVAADPPQYSGQAMALKQGMRKLWTDHVVWTRDYIIAAVGDQPDAQAAATRLMKNQDDIGQAVALVYGAPAGQQADVAAERSHHDRR